LNKTRLKKIYLLPNVITAFGLSCGLFVIFKMNMIDREEVSYPIVAAAVGILLLAAFADLLDGAIARAMKAESVFGSLFDSIADAITFGVGPSVMILKSLSIVPGTKLSFLLTTAAMIYSVCGVLRLVRFNILKQQEKEDEALLVANQKNFTGLPIPAAAAAAVSANLFLISPDFRSWMYIPEETSAILLSFVLIILGYFMISRWKFPSFKALQIRVSSFKQVFLTVISAAFIVYGLLNYFAFVFLIITWAYVLIAWILSIARVIAGRRTHTLEDFEPEPDELDED
jgi:CDP-diacylglycerol--serine O-phosphatidyltransferase